MSGPRADPAAQRALARFFYNLPPSTDTQEAQAMKDAAEQTAIPGTETPKKRTRTTILARALVGDLVIGLRDEAAGKGGMINVIEAVTDQLSADEIATRWKDQGLELAGGIEVWELRPGSYYRRRTSR